MTPAGSAASRTARLDGRQRSKSAILARLARDLGFPAHFGHNLDALFDVLTTDLAGPLLIRWRLTARAAAALGPDLVPLRRTLEEAAAERDDLTVEIVEA